MTLSLIIAGGIFLTSPKANTEVLYDQTLKGEPVPASNVVTWSAWGTPMMPDGKGGYSLIAPINQEYIEMSLKQPPRPSDFKPYRPEETVFARPIMQPPPPAPTPTALPDVQITAPASTDAPASDAPAADSDAPAPATEATETPAATTDDSAAAPATEAPAATEEAAPAGDASAEMTE